jgi:hypothetical protein
MKAQHAVNELATISVENVRAISDTETLAEVAAQLLPANELRALAARLIEIADLKETGGADPAAPDYDEIPPSSRT